MKRLLSVFVILFSSFLPYHAFSCPTCIGIPKKAQRPFFERHGIRYVVNQKQTTSQDKSTSQPQSSMIVPTSKK